MREIFSPVAATFRLLGFTAWSLFVIPVYALFLAAGRIAFCRRFARFYWRVAARIIGLRVVVRGTPSARRPVLFVANHASYLDIVVLGSVIEAAFVAKKEVSQWPAFGIIARLGRTFFVERLPRKSLEQRDAILERFSDAGESLILFPEGTSNDGNHVLPFKSALFSVAGFTCKDGTALPVQPISIAYTRLDGMPLGHAWRALYAWYGDMDLAPHLWTVLGIGTVTVEVAFHEPVALADFPSRKALSDHCHHVVASGVVLANAGRQDAAGRVPDTPGIPSDAAGAA